MAEALSMMSAVFFIVSAVCFVFAIFIWFKLRILTVIGDLSGATAKKSIAKMRENNEKSGNKIYRPSTTNIKRGKLTDTMSMSNKLNKEVKNTEEMANDETAILSENKGDSLSLVQTGLLDDNVTDVLLEEDNETDLLIDNNETECMTEKTGVLEGHKVGKNIVIIDTVILIHTKEVI